MKPIKIAFAGFRHNHVHQLLNEVRHCRDFEVVGYCEEDPATRASLSDLGIDNVRTDYEIFLEKVDCEVVAIGDYYGKRGDMTGRALETGRHVISDKPVCTALSPLKRIIEVSKQSNLCVQMMLDLRCHPAFTTLKTVIDAEGIGPIHTINVLGQHPFQPGQRPQWYFDPDKHGGTLNDIGVHALDMARWLTGDEIDRIDHARVWTTDVQHSGFGDAAQMVFAMRNGCGVMADVSYLAPNGCGYALPSYWRISCFGANGWAETSLGMGAVRVALHHDEKPRDIQLQSDPGMVYLNSLINRLRGSGIDLSPSTDDVLAASRWAVQAQQLADGSA